MVAAVLVACVALLVLGPRIEPVASILSPVFVPIQSVVSGVSDDVGGTVGSLARLPRLQSENNALRRQNAVLAQQLARLPLLRRENAALTRELNFHDLNPHLDIQPARVIGQSVVGLGNSVTVNVGSNEGITIGNPVLDQNGFVIGKITQVWQAGSTVGLLTAGDISIPAMDAKTGATGLADTPYGSSPRLDMVLTGRRLNVGDLVVTSGLGNEFPIGSLIGQISSVRTSNVQTFEHAQLRTAADLNNLEYVQVVRNFGPGARVGYPASTLNGAGLR